VARWEGLLVDNPENTIEPAALPSDLSLA
jgi:hypothetical protein